MSDYRFTPRRDVPEDGAGRASLSLANPGLAGPTGRGRRTRYPAAASAVRPPREQIAQVIAGRSLNRGRPPNRFHPSQHPPSDLVAAVEELLKAIRSLHRAAVLSAVAIMAFALAPKNASRYSDAIPELTGLVEIMSHDVSDRMRRFAEAEGVIPVDELALRYGVERAADSQQISISGLVVELQPVGPQSTISQLHTFFNAPNWLIQLPDSAEFAVGAASLRRQCRSCDLSLSRIHRDEFGTWIAEFEVPDNSGRLDLRIFASDTISPPFPNHLGRLWLASVVDSVNAGGLNWSMSHALSPVLMDLTTGAAGVFPRLQPIWSQVRDLSPREGLAVAAERLSAEEASLQVLGLSMSERVALILAFPGMILLLLYLLTHLLSLDAGGSEEVGNAIATVPIVLLQGHVVARFLSWTSLVIFPTSAMVILWVRAVSGPEEPLWQFVVSAAAAVTVFLISVQALRIADRVRRKRESP